MLHCSKDFSVQLSDASISLLIKHLQRTCTLHYIHLMYSLTKDSLSYKPSFHFSEVQCYFQFLIEQTSNFLVCASSVEGSHQEDYRRI